jgi:hypothetical protein
MIWNKYMLSLHWRQAAPASSLSLLHYFSNTSLNCNSFKLLKRFQFVYESIGTTFSTLVEWIIPEVAKRTFGINIHHTIYIHQMCIILFLHRSNYLLWSSVWLPSPWGRESKKKKKGRGIGSKILWCASDNSFWRPSSFLSHERNLADSWLLSCIQEGRK